MTKTLENKIGRYGYRWLQIDSGRGEIGVKTTRSLKQQRPGAQWVQKVRVPTRSSILRLQRLLHGHEDSVAVFIENDKIVVEFNPGDYRVNEVKNE